MFHAEYACVHIVMIYISHVSREIHVRAYPNNLRIEDLVPIIHQIVYVGIQCQWAIRSVCPSSGRILANTLRIHLTVSLNLMLAGAFSYRSSEGRGFFNWKKTWNEKYERATKNTIAPGIKWQKTYVNGLQWTKKLRKCFFSSNQQKWGTMMDLHHTPRIYII